jgi:glycine/serine hydroxymethyltransferase
MKEGEMRTIAEIIDRALTAGKDSPQLAALRQRAADLADSFPLYPELAAS